MATTAPSWASPQTGGAIKRSQYLSEAIRSMKDQSKDAYSTASGTNMNILADAILGFSRNDADAKADAAVAADKTRLSDAIRGQFPDQRGLEQQELASSDAFDLTPGANEQRKAQGGIGNLASLIFEASGDPTAAIQTGMGQQRQAIEDKRYGEEQKYSRGRDARGDFVADRTYQFGVDRADKGDEQWDKTFTQADQQFAKTMGLSQAQLAELKRHNIATEGLTAAEIQAKLIEAASKTETKQTPMQTAVDKNWADDLVDWQTNGAPGFVRQMSQLDEAIGRLKGPEELSGPGTTMLPGPMRDWFGQAGKEVQQQVQEVVQTSLRQVLGAQFTQKEGEGIMARTFDPTLEEGVNAQRAERLMAQMKIAAEQKNKALDYFNANGTMNGYQGHIPTVADFNAAIMAAPIGQAKNLDGSKMTPESAAKLKSFFETNGFGMTGTPEFMAQVDALLSEDAKPDLVAKWGKR